MILQIILLIILIFATLLFCYFLFVYVVGSNVPVSRAKFDKYITLQELEADRNIQRLARLKENR